jgi:hypothetical protein
VIGGDEDRDLARLEAMRTALRQGTTAPTLIVDADQRWAPEEAIRRLRAMERMFDIAWVEGATRSGDIPGLKQISDAIRGAVCVGRELATRDEFLPHFQHRSADVIQLDIGVTGITGARAADAAYHSTSRHARRAPGNVRASRRDAPWHEVVDQRRWPSSERCADRGRLGDRGRRSGQPTVDRDALTRGGGAPDRRSPATGPRPT